MTSQSPRPITGIVAAASLDAPAVPGESTYTINWASDDGSFVSGIGGQKSIFGYFWPDFARVDPQRMVGKRVSGLELPSGHIWWLFIEPPAGVQCSQSSVPPPLGSIFAGAADPRNQPTPGGGGPTLGAPEGGSGGVA